MAKSVYKPRNCPECGKLTRVSNGGSYYAHGECPQGGKMIPSEELTLPPPPSPDPVEAFLSTYPEEECPTTQPATAETQPSTSTPPPPTPGQSSSSTSPLPDAESSAASESSSPTSPSGPPAPAGDALPGIDDYADKLAKAQLAAYRAQSSQYAHPEKPPSVPGGYAQPAKVNPVVTQAVPMGDLGKQLTAMFKEIFRQYTTMRGRSTQTTLGPSQVGTPCDRRLAMHLMEMKPVNPGGDGWAAFEGTCVHVGLEEMMTWADANSGRFATEVRVTFPNKNVPHGTLDLLDRVLCMVDDHKVQGQFAADKLRREGPSPEYRIQLHVYAFGASIRGEKITHVGLISWPRDKPNLDNLYVWTEPYDPAIAREALARVDGIADKIELMQKELEPDGDWAKPRDWEVAERFQIDNSHCTYCPFLQERAKDLSNGGCNGRH